MPRQPKSEISGWRRQAKKGASSLALVKAGAQASNIGDGASIPSGSQYATSSWSSKAMSGSESSKNAKLSMDPSQLHLKNIGADDLDMNGIYRFNNRRELQISMPSLVVTFDKEAKPLNKSAVSSNSLLTSRTSSDRSRVGKGKSKNKSSKGVLDLSDSEPDDPGIVYNAVSTASLLSARNLEEAYRQAVEHKQQVEARHPFSAPIHMSKPLVYLPREESRILVKAAEQKAAQAALIGADPSTKPGSFHYTASQSQLLALPDINDEEEDEQNGLNKEGIQMLKYLLSQAKAAQIAQSMDQLNGLAPSRNDSNMNRMSSNNLDNMDYIISAVGNLETAESLAKRIRTKNKIKDSQSMRNMMNEAVNADMTAFSHKSQAIRARQHAKRRAAELVKALEDEAYQQAEFAIQLREHERLTRSNALGAVEVSSQGVILDANASDDIDDLARLAGLLDHD